MSGLLTVQRLLSSTPLAAQHDAMLARAPSRPRRAIPWDSFDRNNYPEEALALSADQAKKLAEGEYGAVGLFGQIASGLALTKAPFDIISAAATIAGDEIRHADYCVHLAELCAGSTMDLRVDRTAVLDACRNLDQIEEVDFFLLKYSAIGETLAAALLTECRRGAIDRVARAVYTALSSDEVHHARLGWYYFAWRAPQWTVEERRRLSQRIAEFVITLEREFWIGRDAPRPAAAAARALGVLDSWRQREAISDVMETEIVPGLDALGLDGTAIWQARLRCAPRAKAPKVAAETETRIANAMAVSRGADWLEQCVGDDGSVRFSVNPSSGMQVPTGLMHHGRAAVVLTALRTAGRTAVADRVQTRLMADIRAGLSGAEPDGWVHEPARVAGTLALACLAGCDLRAELEVAARATDFTGEAWHAAQVVTALGRAAPDEIYAQCVRDLESSSWAPWTARAASLRGDEPVRARCVRSLVVSLNVLDDRGCAMELPAPEIARVAATVEALTGEDSEEAEMALAAARAYLRRWQFAEPVPPGLAPELCSGAFPLSPDATELRSDVTAHAVLALSG